MHHQDDHFASLYDELRVVASRMRWGFCDLPHQTTDVVHATYLRMATRTPTTIRDRAHYLALASRAMRFYLVDEARRARAEKRGGLRPHEPLTPRSSMDLTGAEALLELVEAIDRLKESAEQLGRVVELHTFGLRHAEIAEVIGKTTRTVGEHLRRGRLELARLLELDRPDLAQEVRAGAGRPPARAAATDSDTENEPRVARSSGHP